MSDSWCDATKSGYVCTKPRDHAGKHEAWDGDPAQYADAKCIVAWPNARHKWQRPWWRIFFTFDRRCLKCGAYLARPSKGPRGGLTYELRYPDGSKLTASTKSMPPCSGTR